VPNTCPSLPAPVLDHLLIPGDRVASSIRRLASSCWPKMHLAYTPAGPRHRGPPIRRPEVGGTPASARWIPRHDVGRGGAWPAARRSRSLRMLCRGPGARMSTAARAGEDEPALPRRVLADMLAKERDQLGMDGHHAGLARGRCLNSRFQRICVAVLLIVGCLSTYRSSCTIHWQSSRHSFTLLHSRMSTCCY
jgi:hypothetical protein